MASDPTGPEWWVAGRSGTLSPWAQSQVFALCKISEQKGIFWYDSEIAMQVYKVGGGHPSRQAIRTLREKFEADPEWYPGKVSADAGQPGRPKVISPIQESALAKSAMTLKTKGIVPSAASIIAQCKKASLNPETGEPFTAKVILEVFKTRCYDHHPDKPWQHLPPNYKTALSPELKAARVVWAKAVLDMGHQAAWFHRHCVWLDPCSSIIPGHVKAGFDQQVALQGKGKRWMSPDAKGDSQNLRASPYAGKQAHWGDKKVWWFIVLAQGKVHVEVMPPGWTQNGDGQAQLVSLLPAILRRMLGDQSFIPDVVFTDRGPGFFHPSTGTICPEYVGSLEAHGFKAWAGDHSKWQPPDLADLLLHETAVAWVRKYLKHHPLPLAHQAQEKNTRALKRTLEAAVDHINTFYAVDDLCRSLPKRLKLLVDEKGERLKY